MEITRSATKAAREIEQERELTKAQTKSTTAKAKLIVTRFQKTEVAREEMEAMKEKLAEECMERKAMEAIELEMGYELARQDANNFVLFRKLPTELRLAIWKLARPEPRLIKLAKSRHYYRYSIYSPAKIPSLLHTCRESRQVALKWYKLSFGSTIPECRGGFPKVYFDHTVDGVLVQCVCSTGQTCECADYTYRIHRNEMMKIKTLVWEGSMEKNHPGFVSRYRFPAVEELMVIRKKSVDLRVEMNLSRLVEDTDPTPHDDDGFWFTFNILTSIILSSLIKNSQIDRPSALRQITRMKEEVSESAT